MTTAALNSSVLGPVADASVGTSPDSGRDVRDEHDRFWSDHGVRVVRREAERFGTPDAARFLLLDEDELVLFDPRPLARLLSARRGGVVRLRVAETDGQDYSEHVIADGSGRLVSIQRRYTPAVLRETDVLLTADPLIASLWRRSPSGDAARRAVRLAAGLHGHRDASCAGRVFDGAVPDHAERCRSDLAALAAEGFPATGPPAPPGTAWRRFARRAFDITFSLAALVATAPLYPLIMLAIWLEDGRPFFFAHTRQTIGGRSFACYKIRTMARNADADRDLLADRNVCDGPQFHIEDDPRLLRVGRVLRRLHLDELPQFVNVLRGEMSVIGPRPSPEEENQYCPAWREARLSVKPGITGLWQVDRTRAPDSDFQEWIRHDLEYVERRSWGLDALIIYKTIKDICRRAAGQAPGRAAGQAPDRDSARHRRAA